MDIQCNATSRLVLSVDVVEVIVIYFKVDSFVIFKPSFGYCYNTKRMNK